MVKLYSKMLGHKHSHGRQLVWPCAEESCFLSFPDSPPGPISSLAPPPLHSLITAHFFCHASSQSVVSHSAVPDSLQPHILQPIRLLCTWEFSRQEYWSGLPFPSPGDLPNLGMEPDLLYCRHIIYWLSYQGSPSHSVGNLILKCPPIILVWSVSRVSFQGFSVALACSKYLRPYMSIWMGKPLSLWWGFHLYISWVVGCFPKRPGPCNVTNWFVSSNAK